LRSAFGKAFVDDFAVALWDGTVVEARTVERFRFHITAPYALRAAFRRPLDLHPGEAYIAKWLDITGDFEYGIDRIERTMDAVSPLALPRVLALLLQLPKPPEYPALEAPVIHGKIHTKERDAAAVASHYDQPLSFYRTFLDERLVYSCAYYDDSVTTLDDAQTAKIDYLMRKLRLKDGERLLDVGCGWGGLLIRAAQTHGITGLGITLSRVQYDEANRRIAEAGLGDRVRVVLRDYRDLRGETFDKIVSVGMVEHVGRERVDDYFAAAYAALRDGGLFVNHGITSQHTPGEGERVTGFVARHVFPDGELLAIDTTLRAAERAGFEIRDVENLREHYARTLRAWATNLDAHRDAAIAATSERTYRVWKLYMTGSARGFSLGRIGLCQTVFAKRRSDGVASIPATRRDLYR
jgi:cyclopropane-fatty-acyl-phospholipid synthase